ncbi:MAG: formylglycine-generating enzyme family protein [Nitrospiria bacterium]
MAISRKKIFVLAAVLTALLLSFLYLYIALSEHKSPPEMIRIPAGPFIMGSNDVDEEKIEGELGNKKPFYLDEHPERTIFLPDFLIDRFEVTHQDYAPFIQERTRNPPPYWGGIDHPRGQALLPVVEVNWYEAQDFCHARGKRLPTEAEWEKAARGPNGNLYAWGNAFDPAKGNVSAGTHGGIMMVGRFSHDRSFYGLYDMTGNVMEWTADWYQQYPGGDYESADFGEQYKVARGDAYGDSGHYSLPIFSRLTYRQNVYPEERLPFLGFRCAKDL